MKSRKIIAAFLLLCILLVSMPAVYADLDRVVLQTFPGSNTGNDLPYVGQEISAFRVTAKTNNVTVSNWTLVDDYGSPCYDYVRARYYTLSINLASTDGSALFSPSTIAIINNEAASLAASADGRTATVTRRIYPLQIRPDIWHSPTDETHDAGDVFSFTASAAPYYSSFAWILVTPDGEELNAEAVQDRFPNTTAVISDLGRGNGVRCNLHEVPNEMNNWKIYCLFANDVSEVKTQQAELHVNYIATPTPEPTPEPTPIPTPEPTPEPTPVPTPEPTPEEGIFIDDWDSAWTYDEDYHWHKSLKPDSSEISDRGTHTMDWTETKPATLRSDGEEEGICSVCGYSASRSVPYTGLLSSVGRLFDEAGLVGMAIVAICAILALAILVIIIRALADGISRKRRKKRR
jgi:hypothetical protein